MSGYFQALYFWIVISILFIPIYPVSTRMLFNDNALILEKCRTLDEQSDPCVWTKISIVVVKIIVCGKESSGA